MIRDPDPLQVAENYMRAPDGLKAEPFKSNIAKPLIGWTLTEWYEYALASLDIHWLAEHWQRLQLYNSTQYESPWLAEYSQCGGELLFGEIKRMVKGWDSVQFGLHFSWKISSEDGIRGHVQEGYNSMPSLVIEPHLAHTNTHRQGET